MRGYCNEAYEDQNLRPLSNFSLPLKEQTMKGDPSAAALSPRWTRCSGAAANRPIKRGPSTSARDRRRIPAAHQLGFLQNDFRDFPEGMKQLTSLNVKRALKMPDGVRQFLFLPVMGQFEIRADIALMELRALPRKFSHFLHGRSSCSARALHR